MTERGNRIRQSAPIDTEQESNPSIDPKKIVKEWNPTKTKQIVGILLLVLGISTAISLISYVFTWRADQSLIENPESAWESIKNARQLDIKNWSGYFGAYIAHQLYFKGFGIASLVFPFLSVLFSIRLLFNIQLLKTKPVLANSIFLLAFVSVFFGYILSFFPNNLHVLSGAVGYFVNDYLISVFGKAGVFLGLCGLGLIFTVSNFTIDFTKLIPKKAAKTEDPEFNKIRVNPDDAEDPLRTDLEAEIIEEAENQSAEDLGIEVHVQEDDEEPFEEELEDFEEEITEKEVLDKHQEVEMIVQTPTEEFQSFDDEIEAKSNELVEQFGEFDPTLDLAHYKFPPADLLRKYGEDKIDVTNEELVANKNKIVETLSQFQIGVDKIQATVGPTVTLYEIVPSSGVRITKIKNLVDDIALSLKAIGIRIIAPMPGKGTIGIEVPNQNPSIVSMHTMISSERFQNCKHDLPLALGKTITNEIYIADLAKMPHLLIAGATGQGKSVGINTILLSLLYKRHPSELKFIMVDPKKVELSLFNKIERHYLAKLPDEEEAIITDTQKVVKTLKSLCKEMDIRYDLLKDANVRNLKEYNMKFTKRRLNPENGHRYLPYIVLVIDEFADLIMTAGKDVETPIARIAQLARAVGIHAIIATQRPSVNIITGTIKANFPARIAFRVTSKIDSRTILDAGGADQLIGKGDMLLTSGNDLLRLQCAFVDTEEVENINNFIGEQRAFPTPFLLPEVEDEESSGGSKDINLDERDSMFDDAARVVVVHQQGSTSLIQRKLKLGYNRAGRIMDQLEAAGIVGPFEGSKARQVYFADEYSLEQHLNQLNQKD
jgi:DNA segregation ATPase FtsK/SpoIIIE, S-DNA-T family